MVRPEDFFAYDKPLPPRLGGTEWESHVEPVEGKTDYDYLTAAGLTAAGYRFVASYRDKKETGPPDIRRAWLHTGDSVYMDVGPHIEWTTREELGPLRIAAADFAGMAAVSDIVNNAVDTDGKPIAHQGIYRRTGSGFGERLTSGYHVNHLLPKALLVRCPWFLNFYVSTLASRGWAWNGTVSTDGYLLSQKAAGIGLKYDYSKHYATTEGRKPMAVAHGFQNNDDPTTRYTEYSRLEERNADAPLWPNTGFLMVAAGSLALRAGEHPERMQPMMRDMLFRNPVAALHTFAADSRLRATAELENGQNITMADHQEMLANIAMHMTDPTNGIMLPEDERLAGPLLVMAADGMRQVADTGDHSHLWPLSMSSAKYQVLGKRYGRDRAGFHSPEEPEQEKTDLLFDAVQPAGTGLRLWRKRAVVGGDIGPVTPAMIETARWQRPDDTRAKARGRFVEDPPEGVNYMTWAYALNRIDKNSQRFWTDPYDPDSQSNNPPWEQAS